MSATVPARAHQDRDDPLAKALEALVEEYRATGRWNQSDRSLILALADRVSPAVRAKLLHGLEDELRSPLRRGSQLFENVIYLINRREHWTANTLRDQLKEQGIQVDEKALRNCIDYLCRSGRFRRVARGQYAVAGAGLVTSDPMPQYDIPKGGENED